MTGTSWAATKKKTHFCVKFHIHAVSLHC